MRNNSHDGISRRSFLKSAGAVGALGLAGGALTASNEWLSEAVADGEPEEYVSYTFHQDHCGGMCPLKCTVRDGRLVMIEPNNCVDDLYETVCVKGLSEVQHIYGYQRIQTPLRRTGERGEGQFEPITWDEALDEIVARIQEIQAQYGNQAIMYATSSESRTTPNFLQQMLGAQGRGWTGIDVGHGGGFDPAFGWGGGFATSNAEARDWASSKLLLAVGTNYLESSLPNARLFFEAMDAGCKTIVVDPHFSTTASKADEWIPIEPGTDAAFYLGMISHVLDNGLVDEEFMAQHTSLPYLVDTATGMLLRDHDIVEGEDATANPFMVFDAKKHMAVSYLEATEPDLTGSTRVSGKDVTTVYNLLLESQKPYTVEWASEICGIPAETIARIAEEYAAGPSCLSIGWGGGDKMSNADIAGHAAAILIAITGNMSKPGASAGVFVGGSFGSGYSGALASWPIPEDWANAEQEMPSYDMRRGDGSVHGVIVFGDNAQQAYANMNLTKEWYASLDLAVQFDPYFTEGCKWCDYVLPVTTRFENDAEYSNIKTGYNNLVMQCKVIDPLFEAKTEWWIQQEIAKRLGKEAGLPPTPEDIVKNALSASSDPYIAALTPEAIIENQGVYPLQGIEEPFRAFQDHVFFTESGRMDVYQDVMVPYNQQLPTWEPCIEATRDNPLHETYPFQLSNVRTRFHIHNQFNDALWIRQFERPTAEINPADVEALGLGIETGDVVRVYNDRGSIKVYAALNESVRPGSVRMHEAATSDYTVEGNLQELTNDTMIERGYLEMAGPMTPFSDTLVAIEKA